MDGTVRDPEILREIYCLEETIKMLVAPETVEVLVWNPPSKELPDDDTTVIAIFPGEVEPENAYKDADRWILCASGAAWDGEPLWWAHLPAGPVSQL